MGAKIDRSEVLPKSDKLLEGTEGSNRNPAGEHKTHHEFPVVDSVAVIKDNAPALPLEFDGNSGFQECPAIDGIAPSVMENERFDKSEP